MTATLPSTFAAGHEPTGTEMTQVLNALRITNVGIGNFTTASLSTASGSYVDITNASMSWTKSGSAAASDILAVGVCGWRTGTAPTSLALAVQINAADTFLGLHECTLAALQNQHLQFTGINRVTGVPAGAYTVKMRAKRNGGAGTLVIDGTDTLSLLLVEVPL